MVQERPKANRKNRKRSGNGRHIASERDRLQTLLNSMEDGIFIVGRDYRIELMNLALRREFGEGEGRLCHEFFPYDPSFCEQCRHGMSAFGPELRQEWYFKETDKTYDMAVSAIHEPDGSISRIHILRDISGRKRLEGQLLEHSRNLEAKVAEQAEKLLRQERLALLGEISAGLAHELRTPLGAIITGIKLLEKGDQKPEERDLLFGLLRKETARLESRLSEFLAYAKTRTPRPTPTDISTLFREIEAILSTDAQLLGEAELKSAVQPDLPEWPLDTYQMKEVLLNLCVNALKAMRGKGGVLSLEARSHGDLLEIIVRDNGPGIPLDGLPHIFKPFYSRRPDGTGLGLAISKEIVESHAGRITVTSFPKLGATFRITLPRF